MIYDPSTSYDVIQETIPSVAFVDYWGGLFPFTDSFTASIHNMSDTCGYSAYMDKYLTFPASGLQPGPTDLPGTDANGYTTDACDVYDAIYNEIFNANPCFDSKFYFRNQFSNPLSRSLTRETNTPSLPSSNHLPRTLGRPRLPGLIRIYPRRLDHLLQPHRRPNRHQRPHHGMDRMLQHRRPGQQQRRLSSQRRQRPPGRHRALNPHHHRPRRPRHGAHLQRHAPHDPEHDVERHSRLHDQADGPLLRAVPQRAERQHAGGEWGVWHDAYGERVDVG